MTGPPSGRRRLDRRTVAVVTAVVAGALAVRACTRPDAPGGAAPSSSVPVTSVSSARSGPTVTGAASAATAGTTSAAMSSESTAPTTSRAGATTTTTTTTTPTTTSSATATTNIATPATTGAPPDTATVATSSAVPPCTPVTLAAALRAGGVDTTAAAIADPRCTADFASVLVRQTGREDRFAVFELREPVWTLVNIGTSFVCQRLEIPNPDYTDIGCTRWDH